MTLQRRLLAAFLALVLCVLVPAVVLLDRWLGEDGRARIAATLRAEATLLAAEVNRAPPAAPATWVRERREQVAARITWIALDGRVLGDTDVPDAELAALENHAGRPEVAAALTGRVGTSVRHSATVGRDLMYVAVPIGAPAHAVLRLALSLAEVADTVSRAHAAVLLAGLVAMLLAIGLGALLARWLSRPLETMTRAARTMARGDFDAPLPPAGDDELGNLARALETLRRELAARINQLRTEGVKLRAILGGMREGVALVEDGTIAIANPGFQRLLGIDGPVEGKRPIEVTRLPELAEVLRLAVEERQDAAREAQVGGRALRVQAHPLGPSPRRPAVVVLIDMTEQQRLERLRRDFVANASHELRTPVAAIVGVAETLAAGAADDETARASFVDILLRHAQRLSRLTSDLLDIARLEAGYRPRIEPVDVAATVDALATALRPRAESRRITLTTRVPPELRLAAERAAVEQILTNLIDNAIKYTPEGGRVEVRAAPRADGTVELTVEDSGPGIPAQHLPRVFERFYRVDSARSRELGGTGLGLAIVKHLALANGGDIRVESDVGRGSRFHVTLPAA